MVYSRKALVASDYTEVGLGNDRDTRNVGVRIRTRVVRFSVWNCLSAKVETVRKSVSVNWSSLGAIVSKLSLTVDVSRWSLNLYTSCQYPLITIEFARGKYSDLAEANSQNSAEANVWPCSININHSTQKLDFELRLLSEVEILNSTDFKSA